MPRAKLREKIGKLVTGLPNSREEKVLESAARSDSCLYDFSLDAGAVGDVDFGRSLPAGAIVTKIYSDEQTALTSGGSATVTLKAGSTALTDALAFDSGFTGRDELALASSAEAIKISAASELKISIGTAALTAGKVRFFIQYLMPND